jgi:hypothetical protein
LRRFIERCKHAIFHGLIDRNLCLRDAHVFAPNAIESLNFRGEEAYGNLL